VDEESVDIESQRAWAIADSDAAVSVLTASVGAAFGPLGAILGAAVGSYAKSATRRFIELRKRIEEAGLEDQETIERLGQNEALAWLIAEVVRGTVESDLNAKRRLLGDAAIRALQDDAFVDKETVFVQAAAAIDTVDVRVLSIIGDSLPERADPADVTQRRPDGTVFPDELVERWPGVDGFQAAPLSHLIAAGLIENAGIGTFGGSTFWRVTTFGRLFLDRLLATGLEAELRRRQTAVP
jgi:hypothetical protein